jgi:hypothetical protein
LLAKTPARNAPAGEPGTLVTLTAKGHAAFGSSLILVALALVPLIWECGAGVSGWNVLIFGLIAFGASQIGAAMGRWTGQRLTGIAMTIVAVLFSLFAVGVITAGTC